MSAGFTVDNSVGVVKPNLEGFKIHDVVFKGVEKQDYKTDKGEFKVIIVNFENEIGQFRGTTFEPKEEDYKRKTSQFGENPSNAEIIQDYFKQLIAAINPTFFQEIMDGGKTLKIKTWDDMRNLFITATKDFIGTKTQIKLDKDTKGIAKFPGFPLSISRDGVVKRTSTYIGNNLAFTDKELKRINTYVAAKPTVMAKQPTLDLDLGVDDVPKKSSSADLDLNNLGNL